MKESDQSDEFANSIIYNPLQAYKLLFSGQYIQSLVLGNLSLGTQLSVYCDFAPFMTLRAEKAALSYSDNRPCGILRAMKERKKGNPPNTYAEGNMSSGSKYVVAILDSQDQ